MKRKIAFLLAGILAAGSLLGGCGKKDSSAEGGESADGEVTLSFFDKNSGSNTFDDDVAKAIMEKTGVKINVENPTGDPLEKLNLMLTGQNYPDIVLMDRGNEIVKRYIDAGALVDLTDYIDQYPNIKEMYGDTLNKIKYDDGKNYYLSNWYGEDPEPVAGVLMRYDILCELVGQERADSNEPFTEQEFIDLCKQFKEKYPEIDGKESIAVTLDAESTNYDGTIRGMYGMKNYAQLQDGTISHIVKDERFPKIVKFMNGLYTEGLLDREWVVNKKEQWKQKLATGNVFATFCSYWDVEAANTSLATTVGEDAQFYSYKVVGEGTNPDETTYSGRSTLGWDAIAITKNCKNVDAALKLIDFLASEEGQYLMMWGLEGKTWNMENGVHVPTEEILKEITTDIDTVKATYGIRKWTWFIKNGMGSDGTPYDLYSYEKTTTSKIANQHFGESDRWDTAEFDGITPDGSTPEGLSWQKIQDLYSQAFPQIVNASSYDEAMNLYQQLLNDMDAAGLSDVEKIFTEKYNAKMELWGEK